MKQLNNVRAQLVHIELRSVDDQIGEGANLPQVAALGRQRGFHRRIDAQRMWPAGLAITPQQDGIRSFQENHLGRNDLFY